MSELFPSATQTPYAALLDAARSFNQPMLRRHELWAITCYFRPPALETLILDLLSHIKLTDVYVAYNYSELFRYDDLEDEIKKLQNKFRKVNNVNLEIISVKANTGTGLFHSKGYALIQRDGQCNDDIRDGCFLITSGNLTNQGIGTDSANSNFELCYMSQTKKDIHSFEGLVNKLWVDFAYQKKNETETKITESEFIQRTLLEAKYLCKWDGNLKQELSARFEIADKINNLVVTVNPKVSELGFSIDAGSLTKCYFDLSKKPKNPFPKNFLKNYTIKTLIGNWCPNEIWKVAHPFIEENFSEFNKWLSEITSEETLSKAKSQCNADLEQLNASGIKIKGNPAEVRIQNLQRNKVKLKRLYLAYEDFSLPYALDDSDGLKKLFDSLKETMNSKSEHLAVKKFKAALQTLDLIKLKLSEDELIKLKKFMGDAVNHDSDDGYD
jgi:hypothetical protein